MKGQIITANRLHDGRVVFFGGGKGWSHRIEDAVVASDKDKADGLLAAASGTEHDAGIVEPYLIDIVAEDGTVRPIRTREAIRASGPPVREDLTNNHISRS